MLNQNNLWARIPLAMAVWALGMAALGSSARAGSIEFDPTGDKSDPNAPYLINGIDVAPGSALAVNSLPLAVGKTFQLDYQATVSGLINTSGLTFAPPGLTSTYQLTAVGSFTELVTSLTPDGNIATFSLAPNQSNSFFEMYYNPTPATFANNLAGTGFNVGTLILMGMPSTASAAVGLFTRTTDATTGSPVIQPFDRFINDDYPGITTVTGSGAAMLPSLVTYADPAFFKSPLSELTLNTSLITPFQQVDPSRQFIDSPGGGTPNVTPNIGTINGVNGTDFQLQADASFGFIVSSVPEPASIIQASLGLLAVLGLAAWVRR